MIDEVVLGHVRTKLAAYGIEFDGVGVKDIVLPGETKTILAQVVEAGKSAEANVIRRREKAAATRPLLNTAKVMEDNPTALRLKETERPWSAWPNALTRSRCSAGWIRYSTGW